MSHPSLTRAEAERLELLAEEASEVVQLAMKILRHGRDNFNPNDPLQTPNHELLAMEVGNFNAVSALCLREGDFGSEVVLAGEVAKNTNPIIYTYHQQESIRRS